ncbi:hypothetical protein J3F84DRAFT_99269 [Trichoderma pleuroticola]
MSLFCYVLVLFIFIYLTCMDYMSTNYAMGLVGERAYQGTRMIQCWHNITLQFRMRWHDSFVIYLRALLFWGGVYRGEEAGEMQSSNYI